MKLDYLQFLELEVFTRFGSQLEASMEAKIRRGRVLREIFKQERLASMPIEFELAWMVAYNEGLFDSVPANAIPDRLRYLAGCVAQSALTLGNSREQWHQAVATWMKEGAAA